MATRTKIKSRGIFVDLTDQNGKRRVFYISDGAQTGHVREATYNHFIIRQNLYYLGVPIVASQSTLLSVIRREWKKRQRELTSGERHETRREKTPVV